MVVGQNGKVEHEFFPQGSLGQDADLHHQFHVVFGNELHQVLHDLEAVGAVAVLQGGKLWHIQKQDFRVF